MKKKAESGRVDENKASTGTRPIKLYSELVPVIETLFEAAKAGDVGAAGTLVKGAEIMARFVESLFNASPESKEIVRRIASETLIWPTVACPINGEHGPDWTRDYLKELHLGSALNVSPRKRDERTSQEERIAAVHLMSLAKQTGHIFTRGGTIDRNEWKKSEFGKAAKCAIKRGLELFEDERWIESKLLAPIVDRARKKIEKEYRRRHGLERNAPAIATEKAILREFYVEALSLIHSHLDE